MRNKKRIIDYCEKENVHYRMDEKLSSYTTFKIGGPAEITIFPENKGTLRKILSVVVENNEDYFLIGKGSNLLISDNRFQGVAIVTDGMNGIKSEGKKIIAECGVSLSKLSNIAKQNALQGFEFMYGIPGTVGGGVYMNAGAYGGEVRDVLVTSEYYDTETLKDGVYTAEEHKFSYRESIFKHKETFVILESVFKSETGNPMEIEEKMTRNMRARREKQPLEFPSAGSVFKRYPGFFTAKIIEECGLKGIFEGGAQVSEKHAGFIVNRGDASFMDVVRLIDKIKNTVLSKVGIEIECEIKIVHF